MREQQVTRAKSSVRPAGGAADFEDFLRDDGAFGLRLALTDMVAYLDDNMFVAWDEVPFDVVCGGRGRDQ